MTKQQFNFLRAVIPPSLEAERTLEFPACVTIAQAIVESSTAAGWGTSRLYTVANNPFGIKYSTPHPGATVALGWGPMPMPTWEVVNGERIQVMADFQRFPTLVEAFKAHAMLIRLPRYKAAWEARNCWMISPSNWGSADTARIRPTGRP